MVVSRFIVQLGRLRCILQSALETMLAYRLCLMVILHLTCSCEATNAVDQQVKVGGRRDDYSQSLFLFTCAGCRLRIFSVVIFAVLLCRDTLVSFLTGYKRNRLEGKCTWSGQKNNNIGTGVLFLFFLFLSPVTSVTSIADNRLSFVTAANGHRLP